MEPTKVTNLQIEAFKVELEKINAKYSRWFTPRISKLTGEMDKVNDYCRSYLTASGEMQLHIKDGLPIEITKDCRLAFNAVFS
ncbi:MAG: hypothetical protein EOO92_11425 [Pedobacter sp.]|nr:MAG: hypothetical protein EOO92_11425 [Pedobacter sp.]